MNTKAPSKKFTRTKSVTLPSLKMVVDKPHFLRFDSTIETKKTIEQTGPDKGKEKDIDVAQVTDLDSDGSYSMVCGVVLKKELENHYPEGAYMGKKFEITKKTVVGKRYKTYEIYEIE